jgi:hypothetical protein
MSVTVIVAPDTDSEPSLAVMWPAMPGTTEGNVQPAGTVSETTPPTTAHPPPGT